MKRGEYGKSRPVCAPLRPMMWMVRTRRIQIALQETLCAPRAVPTDRTDAGAIFCRSQAAKAAGSKRTEPPILNEGIRFSAASL